MTETLLVQLQTYLDADHSSEEAEEIYPSVLDASLKHPWILSYVQKVCLDCGENFTVDDFCREEPYEDLLDWADYLRDRLAAIPAKVGCTYAGVTFCVCMFSTVMYLQGK